MLIDTAIRFIPSSVIKKEKLKTYTEKRMWVLKHQDFYDPEEIEITKHPKVTDDFITEYAPLCTDELAKEFDVSLNDKKALAIIAFNNENPEYKISVRKHIAPKYLDDTEQVLDYIVQELVNVLGLNIVFKGGYILTKYIGDDSRRSHDVDLNINNVQTYEQIKVILEKVSQHLIDTGKIGFYNIKKAPTSNTSGGIDFYDINKRKILGVDVGLQPMNFGSIKLKINNNSLMCYTVERMLCDKIRAVLSKSRYHRIKDFYDIYIITQHFDINMYKLEEYIDMNTDGQGLDWSDYPYSKEDLTMLNEAYTRLRKESKERFNKDLVNVRFTDLILRLDTLCDALKLKLNYNYWRCDKGDFSNE